MKKVIMTIAGIMLATQANALTLKTGEVLGPDGGVYYGASPSQEANLIKKGGSGTHGTNVYIVTGETISYIPFTELRGKSKDDLRTYVTARVIADVTGVDFHALHEEINRPQNEGKEITEIIKDVVVAEAIRDMDLDVDVEEIMQQIEDDNLDEVVNEEVLEDINKVVEEAKVLVDELAHSFINNSDNLSDKDVDDAITEAVKGGVGNHNIGDNILAKVADNINDNYNYYRVTLYEHVGGGKHVPIADLAVKK